MVKEMNPQITQINTEKRRDEQVINYLKATSPELGGLLNFSAPSLEFQRLVVSSPNLRRSAQSAD